MVQRVTTVAFEGIEVRPVGVQVQVAPGMPAFAIVGLPDKAVSEARERVRSALIASGLALPARRITVNLAPADLPKEGSHYDLPIALGLMAAIGAIPHDDALSGFAVLGELGLDGSIAPVAGVLPAASIRTGIISIGRRKHKCRLDKAWRRVVPLATGRINLGARGHGMNRLEPQMTNSHLPASLQASPYANAPTDTSK
jgi:Subunit ChlI of Mg-chelatase